MLDARLVRKEPQLVADALRKKNYHFDLAKFQQLEAKRREYDEQIQALMHKRRSTSKIIGKLISDGKTAEEAKSETNAQVSFIEKDLEKLVVPMKSVEEELQQFYLDLPNIPATDVPSGNDESNNLEIMRWGNIPKFDFKVRDHVELGQLHDGIHMDVAARIAGARFSVFSGKIATLHRALIHFMLDLHINKHNYSEVYIPYIVQKDSLIGTGQLPKFADDLFRLDGVIDQYLIPTAEVPVTNLLREQILHIGNDDEKTLPLKYVCHSPCFRSEAGSYGRDTRGIIRQHQFEKVELVQFSTAEQSAEVLDELTSHAEKVLQLLKLPYRKVLLCCGDLSFAACKTYDLEVYMPSQQKYREVSSCSAFGDFQARRMMARWRNKSMKKPDFLHTHNGSALAVGRTLAAIIEVFQQKNGDIILPEVLHPYMNGLTQLKLP